MTFEIRPLSPIIGSEVRGLDLSGPLESQQFDRIQRAFDETSLLVIRDQRITPRQHVDFSRRFGTLEVHVQARFHHPDHPEILQVSNVRVNGESIGLADAGRYWHSDLSYKAEPSMASLLHAQRLPERGGDTLFANMHAAYDALPEDVKARIAGLSATHDYAARNAAQRAKSTDRPALSAAQLAAVPPVVHPVVRIHPATRRPALFVNRGFTTEILDLPKDESDALLEFLFHHSEQERFTYRQIWQDHDLVMWDNRATMHLATGCPDELERHLFRTTIRGDKPIGLGSGERLVA